MADGPHFENRYITISQWTISGFSWNFVHSSRFWTGWTSRDQKWKSCNRQTPSSTERISWIYTKNADLLDIGNKTTYTDCRATIVHKMRPVYSCSPENFHCQIEAPLKSSSLTVLPQFLSCFHLINTGQCNCTSTVSKILTFFCKIAVNSRWNMEVQMQSFEHNFN